MSIEISRKFKPLYKNKTRYFIITGGRGSAKSFNVSLACLHISFEPEPHRILFTRYTLVSAKDSIIPEFQEKIELMNVPEQFDIQTKEITNTYSGNEILFRGIKTSSGNQTAKLKSLQGITTWVLDEAEEMIDESDFDKIDLSIRKEGIQNRIILILNPSTKEHWIYKRFFEGKWTPGKNGSHHDVTFIHTTYLDNLKHLSKSFIEQVERLKRENPEKYNHVVMGGWLDKAEGVVYTNWETGTFDDTIHYYWGLDFGFSISPTALVKVAIKDDKVYLKLALYETGLSTSDTIRRVKQYVKGNELIVCDSSEPRLRTELEGSGLNIIPTIKGADSKRAGIKLMQGYKLIVCDSPKIETELNNYVWSDKKSETPVDAYDHALDASMYVVSMHKRLNAKATADSYGKGNPKRKVQDFYKDML